MARRPTLRQRIDALIDEFEPVMRRAFEESIEDVKSMIVLARLVERLERNDVAGALEVLRIEAAAFGPLDRAIGQAFDAGGSATITGMPKLQDRSGATVFVRWNVRNERAERKIMDLAGNLIVDITEDAKLAARQEIEDGYARGAGPRTIALDLVGRLNRASGRREGGVIGLTAQQQGYVASMRTRLLSGDPDEMQKVLAMGRRDKRFDRTIIKAIAEGKAVPAEAVVRMVGPYADSLVQLRAETIGRTETGQAVHAAKFEAFRQGLEKTGYTEAAVTRRWRSVGDRRMRYTHATMDGQTVSGLSEPFTSPSGARLMFPLDRSLGAGANEIVACRCDDEINIDFSQGLV